MPFPYHVPGIAFDHEADDLQTLEGLLVDLTRYATEGGPRSEELLAAPVISQPMFVADASARRLAGFVTGHPRVGPGPAATSRIYAIDRMGRWARSYSRLWRLDWMASDPAAQCDPNVYTSTEN